MLEIKNLQKKFGKKAVLDQFSFAFEPGVYGLLGPNGAGKTTFLRCLTRIYPVKKGMICYRGRDINQEKDYLAHVGYLPQKFGVFKDLKVFDMMQMMAALKELNRVAAKQEISRALEQVNLSDQINSKVGALSGGMVRRLGIAQALLGAPEILLFDEPTAGLDPEERLRFKNIISTLGKDRLVIVSTHIVEDVEAVCDHVAVMKAQNISTCGSCEEIELLAQGKVYEIEENRLAELQGGYHIQKYIEHDGVKFAKILTSAPQALPPVKPNVEDGYICLLKEI